MATGVTITDTMPVDMTFEGIIPTNLVPIPTVQMIPLPTPGPTPGSGELLVWTFPQLPIGQYQLSYSAMVNQFVFGGTVLTNTGELVDHQNPIPEFASAPVTVTGIYTIRINVYNESGELVKTLLMTTLSEPINNAQIKLTNVINSLNDQVYVYYGNVLISAWNGTNNQNQPVANGQYYLTIDNVDPFGATTSITKAITVDRTLEQTEVLIYNESGEVVRHLYTSVTNPVPGSVTAVQLSNNVIAPNNLGTAQNGSVTIEVTSSNTNANVKVVWNGTNDSGQVVTNGQYFIEVVTIDGQGSTVIVTKNITVLASNNNQQIYAAPNLLTGASPQTTFRINSTMVLTLQVNIYDTAGELVRTLQGTPGSNEVTWNLSGIASGLYLAVVSVENTSGTVIHRQVVKVVYLH